MTLRNKTIRMFSGVICTLLLSTAAYAQNETVNFPAYRMPAARVMAEIESQTKYKFGFERSAFDTSRTVLLSSRTATLGEVLSQLAAQSNATYMVRGSVIVLAPGAATAERQTVVSPRTDDRYKPTDQAALADAWRARQAVKTVPEPVPAPEPVKTSEPEVKEYPEAHSEYADPDLYSPMQYKLPILAVKTNLLYGLATLTPNLSGEIGLTPKSTLEIGGGWNRWNHVGTPESNKKFNHWLLHAEYRWWFCERFNGHFLGVHALYTEYNISQHTVPLLFNKKYRYEGNLWGGGITYGYHLPLAKKWGAEFHIGIGVAHVAYKKYDCTVCSDQIDRVSTTYFGPTRAGISLVFMIR